jgi:hypothetical protein
MEIPLIKTQWELYNWLMLFTTSNLPMMKLPESIISKVDFFISEVILYGGLRPLQGEDLAEHLDIVMLRDIRNHKERVCGGVVYALASTFQARFMGDEEVITPEELLEKIVEYAVIGNIFKISHKKGVTKVRSTLLLERKYGVRIRVDIPDP